MKTTKLKCKACGKTFTPTWSTHKYCTLECRKRNTYIKERERIRTDDEYRAKVNQRQRNAYRVHNEDRLKKKKRLLNFGRSLLLNILGTYIKVLKDYLILHNLNAVSIYMNNYMMKV